MEFLADSIGGDFGELLTFFGGMLGFIIVGILGAMFLAVSLAFTVWMVIHCLKSNHMAGGKAVWVPIIVFFPFGPILYYFFGRNAQGGVGANREEGDFLVECRQCGEGILRNVESCTNCGEPRPVGKGLITQPSSS